MGPHQAAALYEGAGGARSLAAARILQGKALSYNNWVDADAAFQLARDLGPSSVTVIKHTNPCGAATSERSLVEAYRKARACDPVSSFGGIVATPGTIDVAFAQELVETFLEVIIASDVDADAREILSRKKNLRVLVVPPSGWRQEVGSLACRAIAGGWLLQQTDVPNEDLRQGKVVTKRHPTESEWQALAFNWRVATHVKSNAIVFGQADRTLAIGAGQMSRVESAKLGVMKALGPRDEGNIQSFFRAVADTIGQQEHDLMGTAVASDAFFPFADGLEACAQAGASCVVQPGGSRRDAEVIAAADRLGMAMVFSGRRHFRH